MSQLEPLKEHAQGYPPDDFPWSEVSPYIGSPPSSPFHGFGPLEQIPGRLKIKTEMEGGEEVFLSINREKRTGRPRGTAMQTDTDLILVEKTRVGISSQPAGPSFSNSFLHACKILSEGQRFKSTNTEKTYKIAQRLNCHSSYIIYLGTCQK